MSGLIESIMRDYNVTEQEAREFAEFALYDEDVEHIGAEA
jgi:hypothetical protein